MFRRDLVAEDGRRLHSEELHNLYFTPRIIRAIEPRGIRWDGGVAYVGKIRRLYRIPVENREGRRELGRPRLG